MYADQIHSSSERNHGNSYRKTFRLAHNTHFLCIDQYRYKKYNIGERCVGFFRSLSFSHSFCFKMFEDKMQRERRVCVCEYIEENQSEKNGASDEINTSNTTFRGSMLQWIDEKYLLMLAIGPILYMPIHRALGLRQTERISSVKRLLGSRCRKKGRTRNWNAVGVKFGEFFWRQRTFYEAPINELFRYVWFAPLEAQKCI